jgi:hypothetical protein
MFQYPVLSTWLICVVGIVGAAAIVIAAYSFKGKDSYDD